MKPKNILQETQHRPFPLPTTPWIMTQIWYDLLFAHWPLKPEQLRPLIPRALELDTFEGKCWIGVVPFRMSYVRPRGVPPVPGLSEFLELNVRTYVRVKDIAGVYFFSLEASNPVAVAIARSLFALPYYRATMHMERDGETFHYNSSRTHRGAASAEFRGSYRPTAAIAPAHRGTLNSWLTERYCLYTNRGERIYRGNIHHELWPLQEAEVEIELNTMTEAAGLHLPNTAPVLSYSHKQEVLIWPLQRVEEGK